MSSKRKTIWLKVSKGCLEPADKFAYEELRSRGYRLGDMVKGDIRKPNNPKFNRLIHKIGELCAKNLDDFHGMDAHAVLKRIQIEGGIACEETAIKVDGFGMMMHRTPLSMSFEDMEDGARSEMAKAFCMFISEKYWPDISAEQIQEMAEVMDRVEL